MIKLKNMLNVLVYVLRWIPLAGPYHLSHLLQLPLNIQVRLMPHPPAPVLVWVHRQDIRLETRTKDRFPYLQYCRPGDWDRTGVRQLCSLHEPRSADSPFQSDYKTIEDLFVHHRPASETDEYADHLRSISRGKKPRGLRNRNDIEAYFERLRQVSRSIGRDGYKTSRELGGMARDEVSVWITRDGALAYGGWANHRLALAELHCIDRLPVCVLGVHTNWMMQQCRERRMPPHAALRAWLEEQAATSDSDRP